MYSDFTICALSMTLQTKVIKFLEYILFCIILSSILSKSAEKLFGFRSNEEYDKWYIMHACNILQTGFGEIF